jgi:predicted nucleic acid-binding protein
MPVLFDSSIYIGALRSSGAQGVPLLRWKEDSPLWLHAVVLEELYAGMMPSQHPLVEKMERDFANMRRILVPNQGDWAKSGRILNRIGEKYGYEHIGKSRLTNDALIAVSAARSGIKVITANVRDFERLAEFCPLQWQIS